MGRHGNPHSPAEALDGFLGSQLSLSGSRFASSSVSGPQSATEGNAARIAPPAAAARRPSFCGCQVRIFFIFPKVFGGGGRDARNLFFYLHRPNSCRLLSASGKAAV